LLKTALVVSAFGAAVGGGIFWKRGLSEGRLTASGQAVMRGVCLAVLSDILPADPAQREARVQAHLVRLDEFVAAMPTSSQQELAALLGVLANAPTRLMVVGMLSSWETASPQEIHKALENMRLHGNTVDMLSYHAVRDVTALAFFTNPDNWSLAGYPGPFDI